MGLAASQARLLSLTARIHDVEFQAQQIQQQKLSLALLEDQAYQEYNRELDLETLTFQNIKGERIAATFDNLCGLGSIDNNIATDKHYVFRDRDDQLILPSDIYDSYEKYGGNDPYEYAMYMLMGNSFNSENFEYERDQYFESISSSDDGRIASERKQIEALLNQIYTYATDKPNDTSKSEDENKQEWVSSMLQEIMTTNWDASEALGHFAEGRGHGLSDVKDNTLKDSLQKLIELGQTCKFKMYQKGGGAEEIFKNALDDDEAGFDKSKFNYYVRYAKLIENEGGLRGCTSASDYSNNIENDPELLNDNLQAGYIRIEIVYDNSKTGAVTEEPTSASSDTNLSYVNKSSIDSAALKRAEAKYNKKLKDIEKIDKKFDMNLNRLETERTALTTEYDSVKKVIQENIDRSFKIFS